MFVLLCISSHVCVRVVMYIISCVCSCGCVCCCSFTITPAQVAKNREAWAVITGAVPEEEATPAEESESSISLREADSIMLNDLGLSEEEMHALDMIADQSMIDEDLYK